MCCKYLNEMYDLMYTALFIFMFVSTVQSLVFAI